MIKQNRFEIVESILLKIFGKKEMLFRWENYEPTKFWYDKETDSFTSDCGICVKLDIENDKLSTSLIWVKIYELEDLVWDYYKKNGIKLKSEW